MNTEQQNDTPVKPLPNIKVERVTNPDGSTFDRETLHDRDGSGIAMVEYNAQPAMGMCDTQSPAPVPDPLEAAHRQVEALARENWRLLQENQLNSVSAEKARREHVLRERELLDALALVVNRLGNIKFDPGDLAPEDEGTIRAALKYGRSLLREGVSGFQFKD